jgi:DNA uptake protein ComE-like DNA-binding protein
MYQRITFLLLALLVLPTGCALNAGGDTSPEGTSSPSGHALTLSPADAASLLAFVNYPGTDEATLDDAVGLDSRAAANIVAYRNGQDGACPSSDDVEFADIGVLDAIPYVGDTAFQKLETYAATHPAPAAETVESVYFQGWQAQTVVWAVNHLDYDALDAILDSRAASGLVAGRPFSSVTAMGPVSYVGPSALGSLRDAATDWWPLMRSGETQSLGGSFDGVDFDEATAKTALAIANDASVDELTAHGMTTHPANLIIAARPFTTVAAVADVAGVGTQTMTALHDYAASGQWNAGSGQDACIDKFESAVSPHLPDLLFMSESDRPLDVVSFAGAGTTAPTADSVLALVGAPSGSTAELRPVDNFGVAFEPSSSTADQGASAAVESAVADQLSDVLYVAVHAPAGSPNQAEVNVYLVGRTSCGDLVGLHAIAIET